MRKVLFILGVLGEEDVEWLAAAGRVLRPAPGEVLIRQGEQARDLFIVVDGHVAVEMTGIGQVARLGVGEVVGEMSFVDAAPPSATVRAEAGAAVLAVDRRDLSDRLEHNDRFAARFYRAMAMVLSDRLRQSNAAATDREDGELDENVLDGLSSAGARFDLLMRMLGIGR